jgi:hypothetical protein
VSLYKDENARTLSKDIFSIIKRYNDLQNVGTGLSRKENRNGVSGYWVQYIIIVLPEENFNAGMDFEKDSGVFGESMKTVHYLYTIYKIWLALKKLVSCVGGENIKQREKY